jgi:hypothetical protein
LVGWLVGWLTDYFVLLFGWLVVWLVGWLFGRSVDWMICLVGLFYVSLFVECFGW